MSETAGKKQKVISRFGQEFEVDTSDKACERFGFKSGDKVVVRYQNLKGEAVGSAPIPEGATAACIGMDEDVLWVRLEGQERVIFYPDPKSDLRKI